MFDINNLMDLKDLKDLKDRPLYETKFKISHVHFIGGFYGSPPIILFFD